MTAEVLRFDTLIKDTPFETPEDLRLIHEKYSSTSFGRMSLRVSGILGSIIKKVLQELKCLKNLDWLENALTIINDVSTDDECVEELGLHGGHLALLRVISGAGVSLSDSSIEKCESIVSNCGSVCSANLGFEFPMRNFDLVALDEKNVPIMLQFQQKEGDNGGIKHIVFLRQLKSVRDREVGGDDVKANYDVGYRLWGASIVLCKYILNLTKGTFNDKRILEIGSGLGLPGLLVSHPYFSASCVHLTDFNTRIIDNLTYNIRLNHSFWKSENEQSGNINFPDTKAFMLDWDTNVDENIERYDVIIGSDLICQESDAYAVAKLLHARLALNGVAYITLGSQESRYGVEYFFPYMQSTGDWEIQETNYSSSEGVLTETNREENKTDLNDSVFVGSARSYVGFVIKFKRKTEK